MAHLLQIDSSPRSSRSHTRHLTRAFVDMWRRHHPGDTLSRRDIGTQPPDHVTESWIAAAFCPPQRRTPEMHSSLALSDQLVDELLGADVLVIGAPMYNFGIPATLKAYIDQIVRVGRTFAFEPEDTVQPYKPLTRGKRAFVIVASGDAGYDRGGQLAAHNQLEPYLRTVLSFIGIDDVEFIYAGNDEFGGERLARSLQAALACIGELAGAERQSSPS